MPNGVSFTNPSIEAELSSLGLLLRLSKCACYPIRHGVMDNFVQFICQFLKILF